MRHPYKNIFAIAVLVIVTLAACGQIGFKHYKFDPTPTPTPTSSIPATGHTWSPTDPWSLPKPSVDSGSTAGGGTYSQVCPHVDPALEAARPSTSEKAAGYQRYDLSYPQTYGEYEYDHIIPIELGGAPDNPQNLFPEPNTAPNPAMNAKWHLSSAFVHNPKDQLEDVLHQLVCSGKVALSTAQQAISTDWVAAYHTYVEGMNP